MLEAFGHCISTFFLDYQYQDRTNILSMSYQHPTCLCWQIYCVPRSRRFCSLRTRYCSPRTPAAQGNARGEFSEASCRLLLRSVSNLHPAICQRSALRRAVKRRLRVIVGCFPSPLDQNRWWQCQRRKDKSIPDSRAMLVPTPLFSQSVVIRTQDGGNENARQCREHEPLMLQLEYCDPWCVSFRT